MIELDDLRFFVRTAELGGVSVAARALDAPKSSVSRSLSRLEARLGAALFERSARDLKLTEAGEVFLPRARRVLAEVDEAEGAVAGLRGAPRGLLQVRATYSIAQELIAPMLPTFWRKYPEIKVALNVVNRRTDRLDDAADLVVRVGTAGKSGPAAHRLAAVELWACASPAYLARRPAPRKVADLAGHDLLGVSDPVRWTFTAPGGEPEAFEFSPKAIVPEPATARVILAGGGGIGRLPDYLAAGAVADGTLVRVLPEFAPETVDLRADAPLGRQLSAKARLFADALAVELAARRSRSMATDAPAAPADRARGARPGRSG